VDWWIGGLVDWWIGGLVDDRAKYARYFIGWIIAGQFTPLRFVTFYCLLPTAHCSRVTLF